MSNKIISRTGTIFGSSVRLARKELGLTQADFSKPLSISGSYVSDVEKGKAIPSEAVIREITAHYRIVRDFLFTGQGPIFTPAPTTEESTADMGEDIEPTREELHRMVDNVLDSVTVYRTSLRGNIVAFDKAARQEAKMDTVEKRMERMEGMLKRLLEEREPEKKSNVA